MSVIALSIAVGLLAATAIYQAVKTRDLQQRVRDLEQAGEPPHPDLHSDTERAGPQPIGFTIDMPNHE